jgi:hypothetical protein
MENKTGRLNLGVIVCKHCLNVIDTVDTERVQTYYSDCQEPDCLLARPDAAVGSAVSSRESK